MLPGSTKKIKEHDSDNNSGTPDSELDSGISINGHYDHIDQLQRKNGRCDYDRIDEIKTMTGTWRISKKDICQSQSGQFVFKTIGKKQCNFSFFFSKFASGLEKVWFLIDWPLLFRGNDVEPNQ